MTDLEDFLTTPLLFFVQKVKIKQREAKNWVSKKIVFDRIESERRFSRK